MAKKTQQKVKTPTATKGTRGKGEGKGKKRTSASQSPKSSKRKRSSAEQGPKPSEMPARKGDEKTPLAVHRARFVEWHPREIKAFAMHSNKDLLAVGRAGGSVEIWSAQNGWRMQSRYAGCEGSSIVAMSWLNDEVLMVAEDKGTLFQLDRNTMVRICSTESFGGVIWDMALYVQVQDQENGEAGGASHGVVETHGEKDSGSSYRDNIKIEAAGNRGDDSIGGGESGSSSDSSDSSDSDSSEDSDSDSDSDHDDAEGKSSTPDSTASSTSFAALACEDGSVRIFDVTVGSIAYSKALSRGDGRILSVCLHPADGDTIYSGSEDGLIRCYSKLSGQVLFRTTVENYGKTPTRVWRLRCLSDYTVVSGDSLGHVQLWDGRQGTLLKSFSQHAADVTALAVTGDEKAIFASGFDSKVVILRRMASLDGDNGTNADGEEDDADFEEPTRGEWVYSYSHRPHTHDVRALCVGVARLKRRSLASTNPNKLQLRDEEEVVLSGGVDTKICWIPTRSFERVRVTTVPSMPPRHAFSLAKRPRLLMVQQETTLKIWRLGRARQRLKGLTDSEADQSGTVGELSKRARISTSGSRMPMDKACRFELDMDLSRAAGGRHIQCSDMSPDGTLVCVAFSTGIRLYRLTIGDPSREPNGKKLAASLTAIPVDRSSASYRSCFYRSGGAHLVSFFANRRLVMCGADGNTSVIDVSQPEEPRQHHLFRPPSNGSSLGVAHTLAVSQDGQFLAVGTVDGTVRLYNLDSGSLVRCLPRLSSSSVTSLSFSPSGESLVLLCDDNTFHIWNVDVGRFTKWWGYSDVPSPNGNEEEDIVSEARKHTPSMLLRRADKMAGVVYSGGFDDGSEEVGGSESDSDESNGAWMVLYGAGYLCHVDFSAPMPDVNADLLVRADHPGKNKRKAKHQARWRRRRGLKDAAGTEDASAVENFRMVDRYRPLLFCDSLSQNEIVVVEQPWLKILNSLPQPILRKKYGRS